jgi:hypothetical protein
MIRKDFVMRMIQQLSNFIAKIITNKNAQNYDEALRNIDSAFENILGLNFNLLDTLSADDIAELLGISKDKPMGSMKCIVAARLLKEKADVQKASEKNDSYTQFYYQKALSLYLHGMLNIEHTELDITTYFTDIEYIEDRLDSSLSAELTYKLFCFYRAYEKYDKAENWLFRSKASQYPDILNVGITFFKELTTIDEHKLRNGNMTKEEIEEGLADFLKDSFKS